MFSIGLALSGLSDHVLVLIGSSGTEGPHHSLVPFMLHVRLVHTIDIGLASQVSLMPRRSFAPPPKDRATTSNPRSVQRGNSTCSQCDECECQGVKQMRRMHFAMSLLRHERSAYVLQAFWLRTLVPRATVWHSAFAQLTFGAENVACWDGTA